VVYIKRLIIVYSLILISIGVLYFVNHNKQEYTINEYDVEITFCAEDCIIVDKYGNTYREIEFIYKKGTTIINILESGNYHLENNDKEFVGWVTKDGKLWDFNTKIRKDITLYTYFEEGE